MDLITWHVEGELSLSCQSKDGMVCIICLEFLVLHFIHQYFCMFLPNDEDKAC